MERFSDLVNCRPSTRVPFEQYIARVSEVVDAGDFFYKKRTGIFDAMPACWKKLDETQRREVAALIGSFYEESRVDRSKEPWSINNIKRYLNLAYTNLDDIFKLRAAYMATRGDESIFSDPPKESSPSNDSVAAGSKLLDDHDGFALKPKKLIKQYQDNPSDPKAQGKLFVNMTNFVCTEHVAENAKRSKEEGKEVPLVPAPHLDVEMSRDQRKLLNPTPQDVSLSELIDQAQGDRAKKKEAKRRQDIISGNINSYSAILNTEKKLESVKDYNDLAASIGMFNAEKDANAEASKKKKEEEEAEKEKKKAEKEVKEAEKRRGLLPGMEQEIEQKSIPAILGLPDTRLREYIRYFFQKKVVNLSKKKKTELQGILSPLLDEHYAAKESPMDGGTSAASASSGQPESD